MVGLPEGKKIRICFAVSTEYRCVTDEQTDGPDILRQHSPRYASRGKNEIHLIDGLYCQSSITARCLYFEHQCIL